MDDILEAGHHTGECALLGVEIDRAGLIPLVFHAHGFTPALLRNSRAASTAPLFANGLGCGRWKIELTPFRMSATRLPARADLTTARRPFKERSKRRTMLV